MSDVPVQLVVAAFQDEKAADEALKELKTLKREKLIRIENAAVIRKDEKGKLHIRETADVGGGKGAVMGGVAGAAIGLIAGPLLVVPAAVGALVGGLTAKLKDSGFSDERLETLGEGLTPGSSAIVAVIEHKWVAQVQKELEEAGADLMTAQLQADIASQLEAGHARGVGDHLHHLAHLQMEAGVHRPGGVGSFGVHRRIGIRPGRQARAAHGEQRPYPQRQDLPPSDNHHDLFA